MSYEDKTIEIAVASSRYSKQWQNRKMSWEEFAESLRTPQRGRETLQEYLKLTKAQQDELKDVGGFVGGTLSGPRRLAGNAVKRNLVTLDLDNLAAGGTEEIEGIIAGWSACAVIYSTRKHTPGRPRLRLILPLKESVPPEEYEPIARRIAEKIRMDAMDPTTFEVTRLMYYPSCCSDSEYVYRKFDGYWIDGEKVLAEYDDWHDVTAWPVHPLEKANLSRSLTKAEDPTGKKGLIGAFCREYTVPEAMEKYLPGVYLPTADPVRYTYSAGSTSAGAILYEDDKFLYSHHATDPCCNTLVNAFDLVRLHKFGGMDETADYRTKVTELPSYKAMLELAGKDKAVVARLHQEQRADLANIFPAAQEEPEKTETEPEQDLDWMSRLTYGKNGALQKTINNAVLIIENDERLKGKIGYDVFSSRMCATGPLEWDPPELKRIWGQDLKNGPRGKAKRPWTDLDDANILNLLEGYGMSGEQKSLRALQVVGGRHQFNDVADYLNRLKWDGKKRIETLLPDYLGAEDTPYVRAVTRKVLVAAVTRAKVGGNKFDTMLILYGPQGIGKSTLLRLLGGEWFCDSLSTFEGKEAAEVIQGQWIIEVGELNAMNRSETAAIKQFLSKQDDDYRAAYGRRSERHERRCVFIGTSNEIGFLKDQTGNRRFWPVDCGVVSPTKSVWEDFPKDVDQIWAEAVVMWRLGTEPLYLSSELEMEARRMQEEHREASAWEGIIQEYLDTPIPDTWYDMSLEAMRLWWTDRRQHEFDDDLVVRDRVCATEVWQVCLNGAVMYQKKSVSAEINSVLRNAEGWSEKSLIRMGPFGRQRGFLKDTHVNTCQHSQ